jgi:hypothetical protein
MHAPNKQTEPIGLFNVLKHFRHVHTPKKVELFDKTKEVVIQVRRDLFTFSVEVKVVYDTHGGKVRVSPDSEGVIVEDVYQGSRNEVEGGDETLYARSGQTIVLTLEETQEAGDVAKAQIEGPLFTRDEAVAYDA